MRSTDRHTRPNKVSPFLVPLLVVGLLVAGCSTPTGVQFANPAVGPLDVTPVLVATTRKAEGKADFSGERNEALSFASYRVSIPPTHEVGQIEWPKGKPDPKRHFAVASSQPFTDASAFQAALNRRLNAPGARNSDGKREAMLFVHGYNTDFSESLYRAAQMKHDFEMPVPLTLFSWPSAGQPELYMYDRDSVKASRDHLSEVINALAGSETDQVTLIAHSLGTELLMETLRQMAIANKGDLPSTIQGIILISPDLDIDVFNTQLATIKVLPKDFAIFVSEKDQALQISSFLAGDNHRVGNNIDETKIKREGIQVVDVSEFGGGDDLNHMTAVTSPALVSLLKTMAQSNHRDFLSDRGEETSLGDLVVDTATMPLKLVVRTTEAVFDR